MDHNIISIDTKKHNVTRRNKVLVDANTSTLKKLNQSDTLNHNLINDFKPNKKSINEDLYALMPKLTPNRLRCRPISIKIEKTDEFSSETYPCNICNKFMIDEKCLRMHMKYQHKMQVIQKEEKDLTEPKTDVMIHKCNICPATYKSQNKLRAHIRFIHEYPELSTCTVCGRHLANKTAVKNHLISIHKIELNQNRFYSAPRQSNKKFKCDMCPSSYKRKEDMNNHKVMHQNPEYLQCTTCNKQLTSFKCLRSHLKGVHFFSEDDLNIYTCDHCSKKFMSKGHKEYHIRNVHESLDSLEY